METVNDKISVQTLEDHIDSDNKGEDFRDFIRRLLSTFMPERYLKIYMSEELQPRERRSQFNKPNSSTEPLKARGPFDIIQRAFTHKSHSELNLETLEGYGDAVAETATISFIMKNWPNLRNAKILADMKQYYVKNSTFAVYSEQLDFVRWLRIDKSVPIAMKDKSDIFEAFIGSIAMIGEFYIGEYVGFMLASEFLYKFYSLQEWHIDDPEWYQIESNMYNDWKEVLPKSQRPIINVSYSQMNTDGFHVYSIAVSGSKINELTGSFTAEVSAEDPFKEDAREKAYSKLNKLLNINRKAIIEARSERRMVDPDMLNIIQRFETRHSGKKFNFTRTEKRGDLFYIFIRELKSVKAGKHTITFYENVARGFGESEIAALNDAVSRYNKGEVFVPISGTDEDYEQYDDSVPADLPNKYPSRRPGKSRTTPSFEGRLRTRQRQRQGTIRSGRTRARRGF